MKKYSLFLVLILCVISAYAKDYNRLGVSYNYQSIKFNNYYWNQINQMPTNGFGFGYLHGFNILRHAPLYIETGLSFDFGWGERTEGYKYLYRKNPDIYLESKQKYRHSDMRIPLNISYKFNLGRDWFISPSAGVNFMVNLLQDTKVDIYHNDKLTSGGDAFWSPLMDKEYNPYPWKTSEFRWQAGLNLTYRHYFLTAEFSRGFSRIVNEPNTIYYSDVVLRDIPGSPFPVEEESVKPKNQNRLTAMRNSLYITLGYTF